MTDADLIDALYRGAEDEAAMRAALSAIALRLGAEGVNLRWQASAYAAPTWVATVGDAYSDDAVTTAYLTHWHRYDTHMRLGFQPKCGEPSVFLCHEHLTDADVARDGYMQDFFLKGGLRYMAGFAGGDGGIAVLGAPRAARRGAYGEGQRQVLAGFAPHLQRAARFAAQLHEAEARAQDLATALAMTGAVVGKADRIGRLLAGQDSLAEAIEGCTKLRVREKRLYLSEPAQQALLLRALAEAADRAHAAPIALRDVEPDGRVWELNVAPGFAPAPCALLVLRIKHPSLEIAAANMAKRFHLSRAEAQIALAVAEGRSVAEIAQSRGASEETVRTQLRSVFRKARVERQAELSALIWRFSSMG